MNNDIVYEQMSLNLDYKVCQSNKLIMANQNLTLNENKLVKLAIMQILGDSQDFGAYEISPKDFAKMVGCSPTNFYREAFNLCQSLQQKTIGFLQDDGSFEFLSWTKRCAYDAKRHVIQIKLNDELKPYLIGLKESGYYTQYLIDNIIRFNSVFSIRLWELILEESQCGSKSWPQSGITVTLTIDQIRSALGLYKHKTEKVRKIVKGKEKIVEKVLPDFEKDIDGNFIPTYTRTVHLKQKIIDKAIEEFNREGRYFAAYTDIKSGRSVVGFKFHLNYAFHLREINRLKEKKAS